MGSKTSTANRPGELGSVDEQTSFGISVREQLFCLLIATKQNIGGAAAGTSLLRCHWDGGVVFAGGVRALLVNYIIQVLVRKHSIHLYNSYQHKTSLTRTNTRTRVLRQKAHQQDQDEESAGSIN